jgi:hypothetical protein
MNDAILDQHVGRLAAAAGGIGQQGAADQEEAFFGYGHLGTPKEARLEEGIPPSLLLFL